LSCAQLGSLYISGRGGEKDVERGTGFIKRACALGFTEACGR
jgi:hypothetical protein